MVCAFFDREIRYQLNGRLWKAVGKSAKRLNEREFVIEIAHDACGRVRRSSSGL
jgi:hypothetical protein